MIIYEDEEESMFSMANPSPILPERLTVYVQIAASFFHLHASYHGSSMNQTLLLDRETALWRELRVQCT